MITLSYLVVFSLFFLLVVSIDMYLYQYGFMESIRAVAEIEMGIGRWIAFFSLALGLFLSLLNDVSRSRKKTSSDSNPS